MVEISRLHSPACICAAEKGCVPIQVLAEHVGGLDEQVQRHDAVLVRLFERLDGIYKQNVAILLSLLLAVLSMVTGLVCYLLKR